jgi:superfamily II DNA or RNA helicase
MAYLQEFKDLTAEQKKFLKSSLQIEYVADTYSGTKDTVPLYKSLNNTHLALPIPYKAYVQKLSKLKDYRFEEGSGPNDEKEYPLLFGQFKHHEYRLRESQEEVVKEALKDLLEKRTTILKLPCSFGKTIMSIYLASRLGYKTLVIIHRNVIANQWKHAIQKFTNIKAKIIQTKDEVLDDKYGFYIVSPTIANKKGVEFFKDIGTLILDECHALCTPSFMHSIFQVFPKYAISLSATPYRKDNMHEVIFACFGQKVIERKSMRAFHVALVQTGVKPRVERGYDQKLKWNVVIDSLCDSEERNMMIAALTQKYKTHNILLVSKRISHLQVLRKMIEELEGDSTTMMTGTEDSYDHDKRILLSTISKVGVGFDDPKKNLLILASDCVDPEQVAGRVFRDIHTTPIVVDFLDNLPTLKKHWEIRRKWYVESGAIDVSILDRKTILGERVASEMSTGNSDHECDDMVDSIDDDLDDEDEDNREEVIVKKKKVVESDLVPKGRLKRVKK